MLPVSSTHCEDGPTTGSASGLRTLAWIHWDDVRGQLGRLVRLDKNAVVYALPMDTWKIFGCGLTGVWGSVGGVYGFHGASMKVPTRRVIDYFLIRRPELQIALYFIVPFSLLIFWCEPSIG